MKKKIMTIITIIMVIMVTLGNTMPAFASNKDTIFNGIDELVKKYKLQGASIALIENGEITHIKNYGYANVEKKVPVNEHTAFKIASISKTMTAYGVMKLVDEGKLDLDKPIDEYLTKWKLPDTKFDETKLTLRTLMSHTSGVTDSTEYGYTQPLPTIDKALVQRGIQLKRDPGKTFEYSSFAGLGICQLIIEEVTGKNFEDYMQKEIFIPLGMTATKYDEDYKKPFVMATPYAGLNEPVPIVPIVMNGSGGVSSTSVDLANFVIKLMDYYHNSKSDMFIPQKNTESKFGVYGLGIFSCTLENRKTIYQHNGTLTGWNAQIAFEPNGKNGIAILTNSDRAFYFTYDTLGVWSKAVAHGIIKDTQMAYSIQNIISIAIAVLISLMFIFVCLLIYRLSKKQLYFVKTRKSIVCSIISSVLVAIIPALWYFALYTEIPFKIFFDIPNYHLFTFMTPNVHHIGTVIIIFAIIVIARLFFKKNKNK